MSAGRVSTGPTVSVTTTGNVAIDVPKLSVAEHETIVVPRWNREPDAGLQTGVGSGGGSTKLKAVTV